VITIKGLCPAAPRRAATAVKPPPCQTVITRAQLEQVISVVRPNLPAAGRRNLALEYVQFLAMTDAARKAGIENDPQVQKQLELSRMQVVASAYTRKLAQQFADVPQPEIEKYFNDNAPRYEQVTLLRIYLPKPAPAEAKTPDAAATKTVAQTIRDRAAKGEDFEKLQQEAFTATQQKGNPSPTEIGEKRRGMLPPKHEEEVFKLKAGEVSPLYEEAAGYFIYRIEKKGMVPLAQVRDEIQRTLQQEKMRAAMDKIRNSVSTTLNQDYFKAETPPPTPPAVPSASPAPEEDNGPPPPPQPPPVSR
jgi:peptidyl-prolyl cis-trans isomerase C